MTSDQGRDVGKMPGNKEEAGSNFLMELNPGEWFQNTEVLWGMASKCNLNIPETGTCHPGGPCPGWQLESLEQ